MINSTSWDDFKLVQAIAQSGSLAGAAELLGVNHSTVFRRLGAVEERLGAQLFERSRLGYSPTPAGVEMVALAGRVADEITDFERGVAGRDIISAGNLRITTNDTFLGELLSPVFASFSEAYPKIILDVIVTHQALNLSRRDADIAIRATREPPETLVGRKISDFVWSCYAPDDWIDDWKNQRQVDTWLQAPWVGFGAGLEGLAARKWVESKLDAGKLKCRFDTLVGVRTAIAAGMGIGVIPCFLGDTHAGITRVGDPIKFGDSLWLLTHADLRNSAKVRAFMDFAGSELSKRKRLIQGEIFSSSIAEQETGSANL